jgi:hypothetical protein
MKDSHDPGPLTIIPGIIGMGCFVIGMTVWLPLVYISAFLVGTSIVWTAIEIHKANP